MSPVLEVVGHQSEIDSVHDFLEAIPGGPIVVLIGGSKRRWAATTRA